MRFRMGYPACTMLDWDDLRFFLAVARAGSLSAAARRLAVTQPTVGRRLDAFERRLGSRLFRRTPSGHALTPAGAAILRHVEGIDAAALTVERIAAGRDSGVAGSVRLTCTEWFGRQLLAPILARFIARHPGVVVELLADVRPYSLAQREADVALRLGSFVQKEVVRRKLGVVAFGLYAAPAYLARHGPPDAPDGHVLVTMNDAAGAPFPDSAWLAAALPAATVVCRSTSRDAQAALAAAGAGLATLPRALGDATRGLRRLPRPAPVPGRDLWLGVHRDTRGVPRVRALVDFLAAEIPDAIGRSS
jgi:DNA-binding transcriptional LysR family regulator